MSQNVQLVTAGRQEMALDALALDRRDLAAQAVDHRDHLARLVAELLPA